MANKKSLDKAWEVHDDISKGAVEADDSCSKKKNFNEKLGHSQYNPACREWVLAYANAHPVEKIPPPPSKKVVAPKRTCEVCKRQSKESEMWQEELGGKWVCSKTCEKKAQDKVDGGKAGPIPFAPKGFNFNAMPIRHVHGPECRHR